MITGKASPCPFHFTVLFAIFFLFFTPSNHPLQSSSVTASLNEDDNNYSYPTPITSTAPNMPLFTHPRYQKLKLDSHSSTDEGEGEGEEDLIKSESAPDRFPSPKSLFSIFPHVSSNKGIYLLILSGIFALSLTVLTLAVLVILLRQTNNTSVQSQNTSPPAQQLHTSCGSTPSEARSRGCKFDILSFAWQTPECYDAQLMADFLSYPLSEEHIPSTSPNSQGDGWKFYTSFKTTSLNETVPLEEALKGEEDLFVDWEFHVVHCTFMWRQMHRAFVVRGWIDSHLDNYKHTIHCQKTLLDKERSEREVTVAAVVRYPSCRSVHGGGFGGEGDRNGGGAGGGGGY